MNNSINDRICKVCEVFCRGNLTDMARVCNIPPSTLRGLTGKDQRGETLQDPKYSQLVSIYKSFNVSLSWLMLGEGEMMQDDNNERKVADNFFLQMGGQNNHQINNGTGAHAEGATTIPAMTPQEENECKRLRAQNYELSRNLSNMIAQTQSLVETNQRLTDRLLSLQNQ